LRGFAGVEVGSNINGVPIGDPEFDWFFAEAEKLDAAVFVHAVRPAGMDRLVGPRALQQVLAYPTDVGLAAASVICSNVILRFPRLRIAFSHGGGTLASLLPRLERGREVFEPLSKAIQESPTTQASRLYYDALVFDDKAIVYLASTFGDTQLMVGTDYPFAFREHLPVERIRRTFSSEDVQTRLLTENARRFLNWVEGPS
jgi:aminocarboxymuconate-semialdehyde decarboxylase